MDYSPLVQAFARPQQRNQGFGGFNVPRPMGGGIMGGQQPQQRPVQQFGSLPRPQQAPGNMQRPGAAGMNFGRQPGLY